MRFTYPFQVAVDHGLRMKVAQAADDVNELKAGIDVMREISVKRS